MAKVVHIVEDDEIIPASYMDILSAVRIAKETAVREQFPMVADRFDKIIKKLEDRNTEPYNSIYIKLR